MVKGDKAVETLRKRTGGKSADAAASDAPDKATTPTKKYKRRYRELPSLEHMLAHGAPESEGKPKTWFDIFWGPVTLAIIFGISLLLFHHAPHHLSRREKFKLPQHRHPKQTQRHEPQVPLPAKHDASHLPEARAVKHNEPVPLEGEAAIVGDEHRPRVPRPQPHEPQLPEAEEVLHNEPVPLEEEAGAEE